MPDTLLTGALEGALIIPVFVSTRRGPPSRQKRRLRTSEPPVARSTQPTSKERREERCNMAPWINDDARQGRMRNEVKIRTDALTRIALDIFLTISHIHVYVFKNKQRIFRSQVNIILNNF